MSSTAVTKWSSRYCVFLVHRSCGNLIRAHGGYSEVLRRAARAVWSSYHMVSKRFMLKRELPRPRYLLLLTVSTSTHSKFGVRKSQHVRVSACLSVRRSHCTWGASEARRARMLSLRQAALFRPL